MLFCTIVNFERQDRIFFFVDKGEEKKIIESKAQQQQLMCVESEISDRNCVFYDFKSHSTSFTITAQDNNTRTFFTLISSVTWWWKNTLAEQQRNC